MSGRRMQVATALLLCLLLALVGFHYLSVPMRSFEQLAVMQLVSNHRVSSIGSHTFQVLPMRGLPFRAHITPFCSALISVLALTGIALFVLRGPLLRRLVALATASAFVVVCNVLRILGSVVFGIHEGAGGLVLFHDWVGTMFGLAYTMAGFFLMLFLLLPSSHAEGLVRAARVSDVL